MPIMKPDLSTPIVLMPRTGWTPHIFLDRPLEWGTRFDAGVGYRVFLKYQDSENINIFPAEIARGHAEKIKAMVNPQFKRLAKLLIDACDTCDKMNKIWADAGAPDVPVDQIGEAGHG